ncbi:MAG: DUF4397 domain-containing protein [Myxococcota bacterium]
MNPRIFALLAPTLVATAIACSDADSPSGTVDADATRAPVLNALPDVSLSAWSFDAGIGSPMFNGLEPSTSTDDITMELSIHALGFDQDGDRLLDLWFELPANALVEAELLTVGQGPSSVVLTVQSTSGGTTVVTPSPNIPQFANVRALHLSPDAPDVSVFGRAAGADDSTAQRLINALAFADSTDYLKLSPAVYDIDVTPAGAAVTDSVLDADNLDLLGLTFYTLTAYDLLADITALSLVDDVSAPAPGTTRVRIAHTAAGVGTVNVLQRDSNGLDLPLVDDLDFGTAANALELPSAQYTVGLDLDDDMVSDLLFDLPSLPQDESLNVFAVHDGSDVFLAIQAGAGPVTRVVGIPAPQSPSVRAIHLSPDAPTVDVLVDGAVAFGGVDFGEGSAYASVMSGQQEIAVTPAGAGIGGAVLTANVTLDPDTSYTVAAFDELATIQALVLVDDRSTPDEVRIRAVHTAVGVGQVDVLAIIGDDRVPLTADLDFGTAGAAVEVDAGTYTIGLDLDDNGIEDLAFPLPQLAEGTIANAFVVIDAHGAVQLALQDENIVSLIAAQAVAPPAEIRVLHLSPDAPAVDAFVGATSAPAVAGLVFTDGTGYLPVPSGSTTLSITPGGAGLSQAVIGEAVVLDPNARYTAVAFDTLAHIQPLLLVDRDESIAAHTTRVRFIHTAVDVHEVDVFLLPAAGAVVFAAHDIDFGEVGSRLDIPDGDYTLGFDLDNDLVLDASFDLGTLADGQYTNLFAVTDNAGQLSIVVQ